MSQLIATGACAFAIWLLFRLERDRQVRTSRALWIPTVWVLIAASRMVSAWTHPPRDIRSAGAFLEGSPLDRFILTALLMAGIFVLLCRFRRVGTILLRNWPILLFFGYCLASIYWSDYPGIAFRRWIKGMGDLVMVLVILTDKDRLAAIKRLLARVSFILIPLSILLIEFYPHIGMAYSSATGTTEYAGVTLNKNMLGRICLVFGLAASWRLITMLRNGSGKKKQWLAQGTLLAMILVLLVMVNSATSGACFLIGVGTMIYMALPSERRRSKATLIIVGMASVALLVFVLPDIYAALVGALGRNTTLTGRTKLWHALLGMDTHPWVGTGYESFWLGSRLNKLWSQFYWQPNEAHNGYLGIYLELGWLGLGFLAVLLAAGYRNIVAALRYETETAILQLSFFVTALIYNFTEAAFRMMIPVWIFLLWAIIAVAKPPSRESSDKFEALEAESFESFSPVVLAEVPKEVV